MFTPHACVQQRLLHLLHANLLKIIHTRYTPKNDLPSPPSQGCSQGRGKPPFSSQHPCSSAYQPMTHSAQTHTAACTRHWHAYQRANVCVRQKLSKWPCVSSSHAQAHGRPQSPRLGPPAPQAAPLTQVAAGKGFTRHPSSHAQLWPPGSPHLAAAMAHPCFDPVQRAAAATHVAANTSATFSLARAASRP